MRLCDLRVRSRVDLKKKKYKRMSVIANAAGIQECGQRERC